MGFAWRNTNGPIWGLMRPRPYVNLCKTRALYSYIFSLPIFSFCFTIVHVHISYHINLLFSILSIIFIYRICLRVFCVFSVRLLVCSICNCYFDFIFLQMPRSLTNEQRIFLVKQWWIKCMSISFAFHLNKELWHVFHNTEKN
jgi:hypothetical protein